jgi:glutamate dehydrogenase (NAD(P)+)
MILPLIGPERDIPAPDINTNAEIMGWIMDTYSMFKGYSVPGVVTGKPLDVGGSLGRPEATGRGVSIIVDEARKYLHIEGKRAAVMGLGNVGGVTAKLLNQAGYQVIAVGDVTGGYYNSKGLNIEEILKYSDSHSKLLQGYSAEGVVKISNEELIACDCDILLPCALENQITAKNAGGIKAKIIVEGANGPTTVEADEILDSKHIPLIPDILANAGGVVVSYFEWVQNIQELMWDEAQINDNLKKIMIRSFNQVLDIVKEKNVSFRIAANMMALLKLSKAKTIRGVFP